MDHTTDIPNDIIFGKNAVIEALLSDREINKILISKTVGTDNRINEIIDLAKKKGVLFHFVPKEKFQDFAKYAHQGVIAFTAPIKYIDLTDFLENKHAKTEFEKFKKVVILDGIEDPHNLGSIIRTCVCAGFDALIIPQRRASQVNFTVEKASAGAINYINIIKVNNLSNAIDMLKNNDYWIIATDAKAKDNYFEIDYCNMNFAIIMGSESSGVSKNLLEKSDFKVKIPMLTNFDSLNVANAASIIIYEAIKQSLQKSKDVV